MLTDNSLSGSPAARLLSCPHCGCTDIACDASVDINSGEVLNTYDKDSWCLQCEAENQEWVEVSTPKPCTP